MQTLPHYQQSLKSELAQRCERNARYSVRAFARSLDVDVGALSRVLSGKQIPSPKLAQKILSGLSLEPEAQAAFVASVVDAQRANGLSRLSPLFKKMQSAPAPTELSVELYRVMADWYHVALLELTYVEGFRADPRWIASELGISITEAKLAVERLISLGLLAPQDGKLKKSQEQLSTADKHISTPALRKNQRQFLEKALDSLENDSVDRRSHTSMTMAVDPAKIPAAKQMIREFNQTLCRFLESGERTEVYNLSVALFPLQKSSSSKVKK